MSSVILNRKPNAFSTRHIQQFGETAPEFIEIWFEASNASCVFIVHFPHSFGCTVSSIERRESAGTASGDLIHCELL